MAVIGAGTMGAGIAQVAAAAGHHVYLFDTLPSAAAEAVQRIRAALDKRVVAGKANRNEVEALLGRIEPVTLDDGLRSLRHARLIIEAIVEDLDVKRALFEELDTFVDAGTILASNTSSLSVTALARGIHNPGRVVGMHFFNPPPVMPLVEVISGLQTSETVARTVYDTAVAWGKTPVMAKSTPGFIVNRVARPYYGEAWRAIDESVADYATIDALIRESGGFRMGPFELMDLIGIDVNYAVTCSVFESMNHDPRYRPSLFQREMVDAGLLGRKTGHGFYHYADNAEKTAAQDAASADAPRAIQIQGDLGLLEALVSRWEQAGIDIDRVDGDGRILAAGVNIALTQGRPATELSYADNEPWALIDLAMDFTAATRVGVAGCGQFETASTVCAGLFQAAGKKVSIVADHPGMIVMRTVAMLVNEAFEAAHTGVATPDAIDIAMRGGVSWPQGPFAMAERVGCWQLLEVLENLADVYSADRYRPSLGLKRAVWKAASV